MNTFDKVCLRSVWGNPVHFRILTPSCESLCYTSDVCKNMSVTFFKAKIVIQSLENKILFIPALVTRNKLSPCTEAFCFLWKPWHSETVRLFHGSLGTRHERGRHYLSLLLADWLEFRRRHSSNYKMALLIESWDIISGFLILTCV